MDKTTLAVYDAAAPAFVQRWLTENEPADLYALFRQFFRPGLTADIGSGSGRDAAWLTANGFPAIGYDLSEGFWRKPAPAFRTLNSKKPRCPS